MKIKKVHSLEEYKFALDYLFSHEIYSRYNCDGSENVEYCGVDWVIDDINALSDLKLSNEKTIQKSIIEEAIDLFHAYCRDKHSLEYEGILMGLLVTEEDVYWILKDCNKVHYLTCVGGIERKYQE